MLEDDEKDGGSDGEDGEIRAEVEEETGKEAENRCRKKGKTGSKIGGPAKADPSRS